MEAFALIAAIVVGLVGLDVAAILWGADSRQTDPNAFFDSHRG